MPPRSFDSKVIEQSHAQPGAKLSREKVRQRLRYHGFSYALDINFAVLAGVIVKTPEVTTIAGAQRSAWATIRHVDQGHTMRGIRIPLRFDGKLAQWACNNLDRDDQILAVGRLYSGQRMDRGKMTFFTWMLVERATCAMPVQIESDPNFIRVRVDEWASLCREAGREVPSNLIPVRPDKSIPWDDIDPYSLDESLESEEPTEDS